MGKQVDHNSFWLIRQNPITKIGVFPYLGRQISEDLEPSKIYQVLRPESELFAKEALESFNGLPITIGHALLGPKTEGFTPAEDKGVDGTTGTTAERKGDKVVNDIKLFSERIKDEVNNGKKELSAGYFCDFVPEKGVWHGRAYDFVQRNIRGNHIALVDKGRSGHDVRVMDSAEGLGARQFVCDAMNLEGKFEEKDTEDMSILANDAQWEENKHPRSSNGKFASSGGAGAKEDKVGAKLKDLLKGGEQDMDKLLSILEEDGFVGTGRHDEPSEEAEDAQWEESKHKRDSDGKFSSTGGGSKSTKTEGNKADSLKKAYADLKKYQGSAAGKKDAVALRDGQKNPSAHYEELMATFSKKYGLDPQEFKDYHFEQIVKEGKEKHAELTGNTEKEPDTAEGERIYKDKLKRFAYVDNKEFAKVLPYLKQKGSKEEIQGIIKRYERLDSNGFGYANRIKQLKEILSSKNHGNSGQDAATEKENKMDKREIIREIMAIAAKPADQFQGGEEEKVETIAKLAEKIAYNPSEAGANDTDPKDEDDKVACDTDEKDVDVEETDKDEDKKPASLDEMEKELLARMGRKAELVNKLTPIIGAFDSAVMTEKEVADYACKKLGLSVALDEAPAALKGYLAAHKPSATRVTFGAKKTSAMDESLLKDFKEGK